MFGKKTTELIKEAIDAETASAVENYGPVYASKHEAYAVLKEEIEESKENVEKIKRPLHYFWLSVRGLPVTEIKHYSDQKQIELIARTAQQLALEAVQIAAVCNKIKESLNRDFQ